MKAKNLTLQRAYGKPWELCMSVEDTATARSLVDEYAGQEVEVTIKRWSPKRSTNANAYAWVLISKLAAKLGGGASDIYRHAIRDIGDNFEVVCIQDKAVAAFRNAWEKHGIGWMTETLDSKIDGCTNVVCYYGSSTYDMTQMSRLIDTLVAEAKENGIETLPPAELERMCLEWK